MKRELTWADCVEIADYLSRDLNLAESEPYHPVQFAISMTAVPEVLFSETDALIAVRCESLEDLLRIHTEICGDCLDNETSGEFDFAYDYAFLKLCDDIDELLKKWTHNQGNDYDDCIMFGYREFSPRIEILTTLCIQKINRLVLQKIEEEATQTNDEE